MSNYTRWYRGGTIGATNGSMEITGSGTYWKSAGLNPGDMLEVDNSGVLLEIASINSDTSITLARPYSGNTVTDAAYAIVRNFTATMPSKIAAQTAELLGDFRKYIDTDMERLTGKSAYEIAKLHGFTGTEAAWLESLKAAGEWTTLNNRTNILTYNNAGSHNSIYRGKNLGTAITDAQLAAIKAGTFDDIYPGDYWVLPIDGGTTAYVIGCNTHGQISTNHVHLFLVNYNWIFPINDTDNNEGGFLNSKMYTEHFPYILGKIQEVIPDKNILQWAENISDSINSSGKINHRAYGTPVKIGLPSFTNVVGFNEAEHSYQWAGNNPNWPAMRMGNALRVYMSYNWLDEHSGTSRWTVLHWTLVNRFDRGSSNITGGTAVHAPFTRPYICVGVAS